MVVATEELSRASLGIGGSLITRPEILTRALVKGGTEEQKLKWLPKLATAEVMPAVAVTEPDFGSDVAGITVTATSRRRTRRRAGLGDQRREDVVHVRRPRRRVCTCSPAPTRIGPQTHRGLSPVHRAQAARRRPRVPVHAAAGDDRVGKMEGRPIDTIGYRGMHSYEIALDRLVGAGREPDRWRRGPRQGLLLPDGGLRERAAADGGPGGRRDAGRLRSGARVRPAPQGVRLQPHRLPADAGQARPDGDADPGRPPVRLLRVAC